tara:strand:- start:164 stop:424 length:261 start_codon:yes stop_codon:yes gene_type:complete
MSDELKKAKEELKETRARYNEDPSKENFMANKAASDKVYALSPTEEPPILVKGILKGINLYNKYVAPKNKKYSNLGSRKPTKNPLD